MYSQKILTVGPNSGAKAYRSLRAATRALSGLGTDGIRGKITRRAYDGGGYVGNVWVQLTTLPVGIKR